MRKRSRPEIAIARKKVFIELLPFLLLSDTQLQKSKIYA
jgi:hypothetical protein